MFLSSEFNYIDNVHLGLYWSSPGFSGITGDCGIWITRLPGSGHVVCPPKLALVWFSCRYRSATRRPSGGNTRGWTAI